MGDWNGGLSLSAGFAANTKVENEPSEPTTSEPTTPADPSTADPSSSNNSSGNQTDQQANDGSSPASSHEGREVGEGKGEGTSTKEVDKPKSQEIDKDRSNTARDAASKSVSKSLDTQQDNKRAETKSLNDPTNQRGYDAASAGKQTEQQNQGNEQNRKEQDKQKQLNEQAKQFAEVIADSKTVKTKQDVENLIDKLKEKLKMDKDTKLTKFEYSLESITDSKGYSSTKGGLTVKTEDKTSEKEFKMDLKANGNFEVSASETDLSTGKTISSEKISLDGLKNAPEIAPHPEFRSTYKNGSSPSFTVTNKTNSQSSQSQILNNERSKPKSSELSSPKTPQDTPEKKRRSEITEPRDPNPEKSLNSTDQTENRPKYPQYPIGYNPKNTLEIAKKIRERDRDDPISTYYDFYKAVRNNSNIRNNQTRGTNSLDLKYYDPIGTAKGPLGRGSIYEDAGNFNYGVLGRALGISREVLLRAAGFASIKSSPTGSNIEAIEAFFGSAPYGDDPKDQEMIEKGIDYFDNHLSKTYPDTVSYKENIPDFLR